MLNTPLLRSKLFRPPQRRQPVARPRLTALLAEGLNVPLALVSAPAGFGKTSLLVEWAEGLETACGWLALDAGDNDLGRFQAYLLAAIRQGLGQANFAQPLDALVNALPPLPAESVLGELVNALYECGQPLVLVLDDYQSIEAQPVHAAVSFLIEHLPPDAHLVIATRADPPLPLARLRARGQLVEVRADDLRFTAEETGAFLAQSAGLRGDKVRELANGLAERTEGWAAGLQMACLALQGGRAGAAQTVDPQAFLREFRGSHRYVLDYLTEEVLARLPEETVRFLLQTAILERFCAELCAALLGEADAQRAAGLQSLIEGLERENLFVIPLDGERRWYRYHQLFADLLRARLMQNQPEGLSTLHARAADWFERQGLPGEAIQHRLMAAKFAAAKEADLGEAQVLHESAARLIEASAMPYFLRGETAAFLHWLEALPEEIIDAHPLLGLYRSAVYGLHGDTETAQRLIVPVRARLAERRARGEMNPQVQALLNALSGLEIAQADLAGRYEDVLRAAPPFLERVKVEGGDAFTVQLALGHAQYLLGDAKQARATWAEAAQMVDAAGNPYGLALAVCHQARACKLLGQLAEAAALYEHGLALLRANPTAEHMGLGLVEAGLSDLLRERGNLPAARAQAEAALTHLPRLGGPSGLVIAHTALARVQVREGHPGAALDTLARIAAYLPYPSLYPEHREAAEGARVLALLALGEKAQAARAAVAMRQDPRLPGATAWARTCAARVRLALGEPAEALGMLAALAQEAAGVGWNGRLVEIEALRACALQAQGEKEAALAALGRALEIAAPLGAVGAISEAGECIPAMLAQGIRREAWSAGATDYAKSILSVEPARLQPQESAGPHFPAAAPTALVEPLSERELEVLRLVAEGLSNAEIAARLVLSTGTVRVHTANIYRKLDVESRTQATAKARALKLID